MDAAVSSEIEGLREMRVGALRTKYREAFGEESRSSNRQFLFRRIAWRLQAKLEGDLSERARRRALEIADDADLPSAPRKGSWFPVTVASQGRSTALNRPEIAASPFQARFSLEIGHALPYLRTEFRHLDLLSRLGLRHDWRLYEHAGQQ